MFGRYSRAAGLAWLLLAACAAQAQSTNATDVKAWSGLPGGGRPPRWSAGVGCYFSSEPYRGYDYRILPLPIVSYFGERFFVVGPRAGYKVIRGDGYTVSLSAGYDFSGYEENDSDVFEGMGDRDGTVMAGALVAVDLPQRLDLEAGIQGDVLGRHDGQSAHVRVQRTFRREKFSVAPGLGIVVQSHRMADYYYGVPAQDAREGRPAYEVDTAANVRLGVRLTYAFNPHIQLAASPGIEWLDEEIRRSPLIDQNVLFSGFLAITYGF